MIQKLKITYQGGKGNNHLVPILVPTDCFKGMKVLCDRSVRISVGILEANQYAFPSTGKSDRHVSGWHTVYALVKTLDLKNRSLLTAAQNRHRVSTIFATMDLPEHEKSLFYHHMGHSKEINENVYQVPMALQEVTKIGKALQVIDQGKNVIKNNIGTVNDRLNAWGVY